MLAVPLAAVAAAWASGAVAGMVPGPAPALVGLWAAAGVGALAGDRRRRPLPVLLGSAVWLASAGAGALLARPWARAVPVRLSAVAHWVAHGTLPLLCATVLVAAGGCAFGRLTVGRPLRQPPDIVHWMLGATLGGLAAAMVTPVLGLLGGWAARAGLAVLAAASGAFWPAWVHYEPAPAPPPQQPAGPVRLRLVQPASLPRARAAGGAVPSPSAATAAAVGAAAPSPGQPQALAAHFAGAPEVLALPVAILPRALGPRRRRRPRWQPREHARRWIAALRARDEKGVLPMTVRLVSAAANTRRLLGLYAYAGLCSAPALWLLFLGPRAAQIWAAPGWLHGVGAAAILLSDALALLACVALAARSGLLHRLEVTLPTPSLSPALLPGVAAAVLLAWGGPHGRILAHGLSGVLLGGHGSPVLAFCLDCLLLPAAQAAFFFGLLQTRLAEIAPVWQAVGLPALLFALSGPLTGVPLPAVLPALLVGLLLAWSRRGAGLPWTAVALAAGNVAALVLTLGR